MKDYNIISNIEKSNVLKRDLKKEPTCFQELLDKAMKSKYQFKKKNEYEIHRSLSLRPKTSVLIDSLF